MEVGLFRFALVVVLCAVAVLAAEFRSQRAAAEEPEFSEAYLNDRDNIERGQKLWKQQCVKCHGSSSYPGKAPKLEPEKMSPREIYLKTTYGFGNMPAWEDVFSDEERKAITAYMKSDIFSP